MTASAAKRKLNWQTSTGHCVALSGALRTSDADIPGTEGPVWQTGRLGVADARFVLRAHTLPASLAPALGTIGFALAWTKETDVALQLWTNAAFVRVVGAKGH